MEDDTVEVDVTVTEEPPQDVPTDVIVMEVPSEPPTVIVEGDSAADSGAISMTDLDQEGRIVRLETGLITLSELVAEIDVRTQVTEIVAESTAETVSEIEPVVSETAAASLAAEGESVDLDGDGESDEPPRSARRHWMFRSRNEWKN